MKKILSLIIVALLPLVASAYDAEIDGIYYNFNGDEATVTYQKYQNYNYISDYFGIVDIPEHITYNNINYSVTSIGDGAFNGCDGLTSVIIGNGVTSVGNYAFRGCSGLTSVTIGNSVTSIGSYAFYNCSNLTSVTIPNSLISINARAFENCSKLTSITIPHSVTSIGIGAFNGCSGLTSVTIGSNVTNISFETFGGCSSLNSIVIEGNPKYDSRDNCNAIIETSKNTLIIGCMKTIIPNSVTDIGSYAFSGCTGLTAISIPNSVTNIGESAFSRCIGLKSATMPNSLTIIGDYAFEYCGLTSINIPNSVTNIGSNVFSGCSGLTSVIIGNSVTSIGNHAFYNCSSLSSVTIPNSVTSIGDYAFSTCTGLTSVTIGNGVTNFGSNAFKDCSGLISVNIGCAVASIGGDAFSGCKLHNVLIKCNTPPTMNADDGKKTFSSQTFRHGTLYVPFGCWDVYAFDDEWCCFNNIRETAMTEEEVTEQQAYTLMDAESFAYSVYDPVNECIGTINSVSGINEDNPNHCWQVINAGSSCYLYNIGAKKYAKSAGESLTLSDVPEPIEIEDGNNGIILGEQSANQWALVSNERMNINRSVLDEVTGLANICSTKQENIQIYNLNGQQLASPQKGLNIINGKKVFK